MCGCDTVQGMIGKGGQVFFKRRQGTNEGGLFENGGVKYPLESIPLKTKGKK